MKTTSLENAFGWTRTGRTASITDFLPWISTLTSSVALSLTCFTSLGKEIVVRYDGREVGRHRLDLVVNDQVLLELKAVSWISPQHLALARSYLKAADLSFGLILNFAAPRLGIRRVLRP